LQLVHSGIDNNNRLVSIHQLESTTRNGYMSNRNRTRVVGRYCRRDPTGR